MDETPSAAAKVLKPYARKETPELFIAMDTDWSDYQAVFIPRNEDSDLTKNIVNTARAMIAGWMQHGRPKEDRGFPWAFVIHCRPEGWKSYEVNFTSDDLLEATVEPMDSGGPDDEVMTGWPCFMHSDWGTKKDH